MDDYKGYMLDADGDPVIEVSVTRRVLDDIEALAEMGVFGIHIEDVARRMLDEAVRQRAVEGWLPMPCHAEESEDDDA